MGYMERYSEWLAKLPEGNPMREELLSLEGNDKEIKERFYRDIEFGTAGLRGICGAGTNRMNVLTVGRATQGIANYILASGENPADGIAIAYDCRYHSKEFAELAAEILAGNGIRVYLFPSLRPTPELSFTIRSFAALGGINLTASHNPKEYNGYKVYWKDGAQISGAISDGMQKEILSLDYFDTFKKLPLPAAVDEGKVKMLGEEMDLAYLDYVESRAVFRCSGWRRIWDLRISMWSLSRRIPTPSLRQSDIPIRRTPRLSGSLRSWGAKSARKS